MSIIRSNFIEDARNQSAHDILHRDKLLARLLRVMTRGQRNNVLILGEPGVGKTALLRGLAFRMAHHGEMKALTRPIHNVDTTRLAFLLSERDTTTLDAISRELSGLKDCVLLLDDARMLLTGGDISALLYVLQPLLERPDIAVCIVCSTAEYRRYLEREPVFAREMEPLTVEEVNLEQAKDILLHLTPSRLRSYKCSVPATTVKQLATLAKRYVQDRALPAKAVSILDESIAKAVNEGRREVGISDVKHIIGEKTGIPVDTLSAADQEKLLNLESELDAQVIGQPHVTKAAAQVIRRSRAGLKDPRRPIASFLFLGSSGVGKTELAKVLSTTVFHNERSLVRFDMSEFSEPHTAQRLVGAPPGYIGFEEGGQLTNAVLAQPYSLILLDELEKAHPKIFDIFLQVMDDGRLTDGKGRTVDFSNAIIIATSNLVLEDILGGFKKGEDITSREWFSKKALPILGAYFRPEFINRFDETLVFSPFTLESVWKITQLEINKLKKRLEELHVEVEIDEEKLRSDIQSLYNPAFGARPVRRYLQEKIENRLAEEILRGGKTRKNSED